MVWKWHFDEKFLMHTFYIIQFAHTVCTYPSLLMDSLTCLEDICLKEIVNKVSQIRWPCQPVLIIKGKTSKSLFERFSQGPTKKIKIIIIIMGPCHGAHTPWTHKSRIPRVRVGFRNLTFVTRLHTPRTHKSRIPRVGLDSGISFLLQDSTVTSCFQKTFQKPEIFFEPIKVKLSKFC